MVVRNNVSRYDKRFVGFGWNKVSHILELQAQGLVEYFRFLLKITLYSCTKYRVTITLNKWNFCFK